MAWKETAEFAVTLYQRWRGTVLNRAGFLLVIAGIGELTSIFQNLLAAVFVLAKIPVPFPDPPPLVGISLVAMGLAALAGNRVLPDRSKETSLRVPHPHDVQLLRDFRALFNEPTMEFLTNHDFSATFFWEQIRPVDRFVTEWVSPRFEFSDATVQRHFSEVKRAAIDFSGMKNRYIYGHNTNTEVATTKPDLYYMDNDIQNRTDDRVKAINEMATTLVQKIHSFEQLARDHIQAI